MNRHLRMFTGAAGVQRIWMNIAELIECGLICVLFEPI